MFDEAARFGGFFAERLRSRSGPDSRHAHGAVARAAVRGHRQAHFSSSDAGSTWVPNAVHSEPSESRCRVKRYRP